MFLEADLGSVELREIELVSLIAIIIISIIA